MKKLLLLAFAAIMCLSASAQSKVFYDSKCDIIGISGHYDNLFDESFSSKFFKNDVPLGSINLIADKHGVTNGYNVASQLTDAKVGNKILKFILNDGQGKISFDRLDQRSLANVSSAEEELAEADEFTSKEDQLKQNCSAQFAKNYIYLQTEVPDKPSKMAWIVLHVDMDGTTFEQIFNEATTNPNLNISFIDQLNIPISFVATGTTSTTSLARNRALRDIGKKVPDFAVRGQIVRLQNQSGLYAAIGTNSGVEKLDQFHIYRQFYKNGVNYSKKIAVTRAVKAGTDYTQLFTTSGGWANSKKGDIAVLHQDAHLASNILVGYQNKFFDINYQQDIMLSMNRSGMGTNLLFQIGAAFTTESEDDLRKNSVPVDGVDFYKHFKTPFELKLGLGYGVSWSVAHALEIMPYAMLQGNAVFASSQIENSDDDYGAVTVRIPIGVKLNLNIPSYRCQLTAGVEYNPVDFSIDPEKGKEKSGNYPYSWWNDGVLKPNKMERTGLHFYAGLRFTY